MDEMKERGALYPEIYAPPYICSYALHTFNILNQQKKIYWVGRNIQNLRLHVIFVAPPGGMKSYYLDQFAMGDYAIFNNCNTNVYSVQNINEAALIGTKTNQNGKHIEREGEASKHANDIICMDEFSGLTEACKQSYNSQYDTQLLAALDHGNVNKSMAAGNITYKTYFTLWGGVQPARYDLSKGMGRRMCFIMNLPDKKQRGQLRKAIWKSHNIEVDEANYVALRDDINAWTSSFNQIERVEFCDDVMELFDELDIEGYYMTSYERIILGYHLAKYGAKKRVECHLEDQELNEILQRQFKWKNQITRGPDVLQISNLIKTYGNESGGQYLIECQKLNFICDSIQMSIQQINEKMEEMKRYHMINITKIDGKQFAVLEKECDDIKNIKDIL